MRNVLPNLVKNENDYFKVSNIIKDAIPDDAETIEEALEASPKLRSFASKAPELMDYAKAIVGLPKDYASPRCCVSCC